MKREAPGRGLAMVEILHKTNMLALVGGGKNPKHPLNKVMLYSNAEDRCFGELAFRSAIRAVKLLPNYVVVVLEFKVYVYDFELKLVYQFETLSNIPGVVATTSPSFADPSASVLACLSHQRTGEVRIKRFNKRGSYHIQAHDETIACLALNTSGSLLATASTKGTLINIFRTADGTQLQEVTQLGIERALLMFTVEFRTFFSTQFLVCFTFELPERLDTLQSKTNKKLSYRIPKL